MMQGDEAENATCLTLLTIKRTRVLSPFSRHSRTILKTVFQNKKTKEIFITYHNMKIFEVYVHGSWYSINR